MKNQPRFLLEESGLIYAIIFLSKQDLNCRVLNQINELLFRYNFFTANNRLICLLPCISQFSIIASKLPYRIQSQGSLTIHLAQNKVVWLKSHRNRRIQRRSKCRFSRQYPFCVRLELMCICILVITLYAHLVKISMIRKLFTLIYCFVAISDSIIL